MSELHETILDCQKIVVEYLQPTVKVNSVKELMLSKIRREPMEVKKHVALHDVSLQAKRGECVALIGHNGCGKSTLLKVIAGIIKPKSGTVQTRGRLSPLIELGAGFDPELTGRENVFLSCGLLGLSQSEIRDRLEEIRIFADIGDFFDAPVKTYSSGMYMRLGFACCTAIEPTLLLIDEILAVGDENFQKKCSQRMHEVKAAGATIILVTHDVEAARRMADRALVIDHGRQMFEGDPTEAVRVYRDLLEQARLAGLPEHERAESLRQKRLATNWQENAHQKAELKAKVAHVDIGPLSASSQSEKLWRLVIDINIESDNGSPVVVGFAILNQAHVRVFGGNTKTLSRPEESTEKLLTQAGRHTVIFEFDSFKLASGRYQVVAAIHNWEMDVTLDYIREAAEFRIVHDSDQDNFDQDILAVRGVVTSLAVIQAEK